jgi:hypothetical protein
MQFIRWLLSWAFAWQPPAPPDSIDRCPISDCGIALRADHDFCGRHYQLLSTPLHRALRRARREHGIDSRAYDSALDAAIHAIERQLPPPGS